MARLDTAETTLTATTLATDLQTHSRMAYLDTIDSVNSTATGPTTAEAATSTRALLYADLPRSILITAANAYVAAAHAMTAPANSILAAATAWVVALLLTQLTNRVASTPNDVAARTLPSPSDMASAGLSSVAPETSTLATHPVPLAVYPIIVAARAPSLLPITRCTVLRARWVTMLPIFAESDAWLWGAEEQFKEMRLNGMTMGMRT